MDVELPPTADHAPALVRWLRGDAADRARYRDLAARFRMLQHFALGIGATVLLTACWYGAALAGLSVLAVATMAGGVAWHRRSRFPELVAAVALLLLELNLAGSVALSGGAHSPLLPLLVVPVFTQAVSFRLPVFLSSAVGSALLAVPATLVPWREVPLPPAVHLVGHLALLLSLAASAVVLVRSDLTSRDEAVVDPMTGLLNRLSLSARFTEAQRAAVAAGGSVGLVMLDVDHFKDVNDTYGHDRGDRVLVGLAERLRSVLRSSDVAYRVGGEEFVVLLPGRDSAGALLVAERIRSAVAAAPVAGLPVTLSAGTVSAAGGGQTLGELLRDCDAALYAAKDAGRNRVVAGTRGGRLPSRSGPHRPGTPR